MAFPRLNALSLLDAADRRDRDVRRQLPRARRRVRRRLDGLRAALDRGAVRPDRSSTIGVQFAGASSIPTALNFLVTIITMRAPGMTFWRMPLLVWANFTTSLLVVIATPFIAGSQFFVLFDRAMHTNFFHAARRRRRAQLPAHLLVLLAPGRLHHDAAGLRDRLRGHLDDVAKADLRLPADGALAARRSSCSASRSGRTTCSSPGMAGWLRVPMMITTAADRRARPGSRSSPGSRRCGRVGSTWTTPMLFALGFVSMFMIGGLSGVMLGDGADRHPRLGHVLHRRPHPLRALRRLGVHDLRRDLLLVPEDDRADVQRAARQAPLLADVHRLQRARSSRCTGSACEGMPRRVVRLRGRSSATGTWSSRSALVRPRRRSS